MEKHFRPLQPHKESRDHKVNKPALHDHQDKDQKHGKTGSPQSQHKKHHQQHQNQDPHHYQNQQESHQSNVNDSHNSHSTVEGSISHCHHHHSLHNYPQSEKTNPSHCYHQKQKHHRVADRMCHSTSSSSSSGSSSSSSSSSSSFSASSSSASSSTLSSDSSNESFDRHLIRMHSQSCTDISRRQRAFEEEDDTTPLIGDDGHSKFSAKKKQERATPSHRGPAKGRLRKKQRITGSSGGNGSVRKAKSMEALSRPQERDEDEKELERRKKEARKNLVKEKMKFSAFLNEITRQVLSPLRLTSLGVTDVHKPCSPGQAPIISSKTDSRTGKPRQQRSKPGSADSISSSNRSPTSMHSHVSKHSHASRRSHSKPDIDKQHSRHDSTGDPPHHMHHRPRSCTDIRTSPTISCSQTCHSHSPTYKHHRRHHQGDHHGSKHHHHHSPSHHHHHHRSHRGTSHNHHQGDDRHEDPHTSTHHCGHHHSPTHHHGDHHSPVQHHGDHYSPVQHHGDHYSPVQHHGDHHSPVQHHGDHHSPVQHHGDHHSPVQHHGDHHSPVRHHGDHHSSSCCQHHGDHHPNTTQYSDHGDNRTTPHHVGHHNPTPDDGDHHSKSYHHVDHHSPAHEHHHGDRHSLIQQHRHGDRHSLIQKHHHGDHHSSTHRHHREDGPEPHHNPPLYKYNDPESHNPAPSDSQHHHSDSLPRHQHVSHHHHPHHPAPLSDSERNPTHSESHYGHHQMSSYRHHPTHEEPRHQSLHTGHSPIRKLESLSSKSDSPRNTSSPSSQDEELMKTGHTGSSLHKDKAQESGRVMVQNEDLHHTLLKTAVRMECLGEEFLSSHQLLEAELQRTRMELSSLLETFKTLQDNCSSTQQTNNLLEQKLHSVVQNMEGERERLNQRISELTVELVNAKIAPRMETLKKTALHTTVHHHFQSDDSINRFVLPVAPPPTQFMDSHNYAKTKATVQDQSLGPVPEEEESDWSEMGEETPQFTMTGPNRGYAKTVALSSWGHREGEGDIDSESGGEEIRQHPPSSLQIPHLQFTVHREILPVPLTDVCHSSFKTLSDGMTGESGYRFSTGQTLGSPILIRSASLEEPLIHHHMQEELRGTEAMMDLHHPEDEAIEDSDNEIIHHWRSSNDSDTARGRRLQSMAPEPDNGLASLQSAQRMLNHFICGLPPSEGDGQDRVEVQGWTGGLPDEVSEGERTQL